MKNLLKRGKPKSKLTYIVKGKSIFMLDPHPFETVELVIEDLKKDDDYVGYDLVIANVYNFNKGETFKCVIN